MILRPLSPAASRCGTVPIPAWDAILPTQRQPADRYLLIAQDDHAHLAGDLAAAMKQPGLPQLDEDIVDAIRMHDCGWRALDQELLARARDGAHPVSFLDMSVPEFLSAWTESIERVATRSAIGGAVVSLHFSRLAQYRLHLRQDAPDPARCLSRFLEDETHRRRRLTSAAADARIAVLTDVLQLCDLISLFLCCGAKATVEFPQREGKLMLRREGEAFVCDPRPLCSPLEFAVAATPWPLQGGVECLRFACR